MPETVPMEQSQPILEVETKEDFGALIPDHAITRLAGFLLPKIQENLKPEEE